MDGRRVTGVAVIQFCTHLHKAAAAVALIAALAIPVAARAQTVANVLLVINENSPASVEVGEYYAKVRQLPANNVVRINTAQTDAVPRPVYEATIEGPLSRWLTRHLLQDQILYIVLTKGIPLRVDGTGGRPERSPVSIRNSRCSIAR